MNELANFCYNVPGESIYGELTSGSINKLLEHLELKKFSSLHILDIGSGSGVSLCNIASFFHNFKCYLVGIEVSQLRAQISREIIPKVKPKNVVDWNILEEEVLNMVNLPLVEISFSFDKAFPKNLMEHIVELQIKCKSLKYVISSHSKKYYYLSAHWTEIVKIPCRQKGSGNAMLMYVFKKKL